MAQGKECWQIRPQQLTLLAAQLVPTHNRTDTARGFQNEERRDTSPLNHQTTTTIYDNYEQDYTTYNMVDGKYQDQYGCKKPKTINTFVYILDVRKHAGFAAQCLKILSYSFEVSTLATRR